MEQVDVSSRMGTELIFLDNVFPKDHSISKQGVDGTHPCPHVIIDLPEHVPQVPTDEPAELFHNEIESVKKPRLHCEEVGLKIRPCDPVLSCDGSTPSTSSIRTISTFKDEMSVPINSEESVHFLTRQNMELRDHLQEMCNSESVQIGELKRRLEEYKQGDSLRIQELEKQIMMHKTQLTEAYDVGTERTIAIQDKITKLCDLFSLTHEQKSIIAREKCHSAPIITSNYSSQSSDRLGSKYDIHFYEREKLSNISKLKANHEEQLDLVHEHLSLLKNYVEEHLTSESVKIGELKQKSETLKASESIQEFYRQAIEELNGELNNVRQSENMQMCELKAANKKLMDLFQVRVEKQQLLRSLPTMDQEPPPHQATSPITLATNIKEEISQTNQTNNLTNSSSTCDNTLLPTLPTMKVREKTYGQDSIERIHDKINFLWKSYVSNTEKSIKTGDITSYDLLRQDLIGLKQEVSRFTIASNQHKNNLHDNSDHHDLSKMDVCVSYSDSDTESKDSDSVQVQIQAVKQEEKSPAISPFRKLKNMPTPTSKQKESAQQTKVDIDSLRALRREISETKRVIRGMTKVDSFVGGVNGLNDEESVVTISTRSIQLLGENSPDQIQLMEENRRLKQKLAGVCRELNKWRIKATILIERKNMFKKATRDNESLREKVHSLTTRLEKFCNTELKEVSAKPSKRCVV